MAPDTRTLLHVAYAGRGDALILEYTTLADGRRRFVLVDGGPLDTGPKGFKTKPYYKYLFHAIKDVWSKRSSGEIIDVDAMICSHPHEDHMEGLMHIMNNMDNEASLLMFDGPFVLPNVAASGVAELRQIFRKISFVPVAGGWAATTTPGIDINYPAPNTILVYERGKGIPDIIDTSTANLQSILMSTNPTLNADAGRVYFTGDNVGYKIEPFVGPPAGGTPPQHFSVYKIQHHGSKNNSEIHAVSRGIGVEVEREGAVLSILNQYVATMIGVPTTAELPVEIPMNALLRLGQYLQTLIGTGTMEDVRKYLAELIHRQGVYKASIVAQTVPANLVPQDAGAFPVWMTITPSNLMTQAKYYFNRIETTNPAFKFFYDVTSHYRKWLPWWGNDQWQESEGFCPDLSSLLAIPGIVAFYSSFTADTYVISANEKFRHPSEATLVGLGLAVKAQGRAAQLYLTEGQTVNSSSIVEICKTATGGFVTANQLFDPTRLSIWYRKSGYYFTLDGSKTAPATGSREILGRTEQLSFATDLVTRERLQNQLEADTTVLPLRTTISNANEVTYNVFCSVGSTAWYLNILPGQPEVTNTINATTYLYDSTDQWPGLAPGANTANYVYVVQTTVGPPATSFPQIFQVGSRTGKIQDGNFAWQLIWERPAGTGTGMEQATFYLNSTNTIVVDKYHSHPPTGYSVVRFFFNRVAALGISPKLQMLPHDTPLPTLKDYYAALGFSLPATISCADALRSLLGTTILEQLDLTLDFQTVALSWPVDPDNSIVDFDDEKISTTVHAVNLSFTIAPGTTIPFDNVNLKVLSVKLTVDWPDDTTDPGTPLKLDLVVTAERSVTLSCNPTLNNAARVTTMRKCLLGMGVTADALTTIGVPKLLSYLVNNANIITESLLNVIPTFLVNAGLPLLKPDLDNSTVDAFWDPTGNVTIKRADVTCQVAGVSGWASQTIAGIAVTMGDITITATELLTPDQHVSITGSATFTNVAESEGIMLGFSCVLGSSANDLIFSISGTDAVSSLSTLLPGVGDLTQLKTPFSTSALGQMTSSMIGFSINQPVSSVPIYSLSSVFAVVNFDDWKAFLPSAFPIGGIDDDNVIIHVMVMEPRSTDTLLVAVNIDFPIYLSSPLPPVLNVSFAADPLVSAESYEFRLALRAPAITEAGATSGMTLANVCLAIGMGDISSGIGNAIPVLGQVLKATQVVELSVAILQQTSAATTTYTFGDWSLSLYILGLVIVPNSLTLTQASIDMQSISSIFSCTANGSIALTTATATTEVSAVCKMPTQVTTGQIRVDSPRGLSIADIMDAFGLPDLTSVPVIGTLVSLAVKSVQCTIGYPDKSTDIACLGATIELSIDTLDLGIFNLAALTLSIQYHEPTDPLGPGYEQKAFSFSALLADGTLAAKISYDSHTDTLSATLVQIQTVNLTQLLQKILPSMVVNAMSGLIDNMNFDHVDLVLDTKSHNIKSFSISLTSDETLAVGGLALTSLSVIYSAATTSAPAKPATLVIQGTAQKDKVGALVYISCTSTDTRLPSVKSTVDVSFAITPLTSTSLPLEGFIGLIGIPIPTYTPPDDCPKFSGLEVTDISGKITVTTAPTSSMATSTSLEIVSLSARVTTQPGTGIDILPSLGIQLTQMRLNITYANKLTGGSISGYIPINRIGGIWILFSMQDGKELYAGDLNLSSQQQMDATDIYHSFLNADEWTMPSDAGLPSAIPLVDLHARVVRNVSIDIWGFGTTGTAGWKIAASGVELTTASLGGRIRILEPPPKPSTIPNGDLSPRVYGRVNGYMNGHAKGHHTDHMNRMNGHLGSQTNGRFNRYLTSAGHKPSTTNRQYDVYIIGTVSFTGFSGVDAAEARLNIKPDDGVTFTAGVTKDGTGSDINTLSEELDTTPGSNWSSIIPQGTASISLDQDGIFLYIKLTKDKTNFSIFGNVAGIGSLLMFGGPSLTPGSIGQSYFVSLVIQDIGAIWPCFSNIMGLFDFSMLAAIIMAYNGTVDDLYSDIKNLSINFAESGVVVPDASTVMAPMLAEFASTTLGKGVFFSGTLSLSDKSPKPMSDGFSMASVSSSTGTVTLWAQVPSNPSAAAFGIIMTDVALLGGAIVINGFGQYTEKLLKISAANLVLTIPGVSDPLDFDVELSVTPDETNFSVSTSKLTLPSPFGNMFSVTFENLGISGNIVQVQGKAEPNYTLSTTSVLLGGSSTGLGGRIIFPGGKPQVAVLEAMGMEIVDVFTKIIQYDPQPGATPGSWPASYNPFMVKNAIIYYNSGALYALKDITYQPNYNVDAELSIFGVDFALNVNIPSRAGIKVTGTYVGTIDWKFVQLGPYPVSAPTTLGPTLCIDTTTKTPVYQFESAVSFFGLQGLDITLQYTKEGDQDVYSGDLNTTERWVFGPWDIIQDLGNAIDIMKDIIDQSETQSCGTLVGLVLDNVTVKVSPKLTITSGSDTSTAGIVAALPYLLIAFDVTFSINLFKNEICTLTLPNDRLIPPQKMDVSDFDTSSLETFILSVFVQFAKNLALAVLENPTALGALIAQMAILDFGEDLVTNLLCRGCINPDLEKAAKDWANKNHHDAGNNGSQADDNFKNVVTAAAIGAAASLFAAGMTFLNTTTDILGQLASVVDKLAKLFGIDKALQQELSDIQSLVDSLMGEKNAANDFINKALDMGGLPDVDWAKANTLDTDAPQTTVTVDWSNALPNSKEPSWYEGFSGFRWVGWANTTGGINDSGTVTYTETDSSKRNMTLQSDDFAYSATIYVWITAVYVDFHTDTSQPPPAATVTHVPFLRPPTLTLTSTTTGLILQFSGQDSPPTQETYLFQIAGNDLASRSKILFEQKLPSPPLEGITITWNQLTPTSTMPASISGYMQALSSDPVKAHDSLFAVSATSFDLLPLPTNVIVAPDNNDTNITASWVQSGIMPATTDYDIEVRDENNLLIEPITIKSIISPEGKRSALLSSTKFTQGEQIAFTVRAHIPSTAPQGTISIFTMPVRSVIEPYAVPVVDYENTYWDIPSQTLHLAVGFPFDVPTSSTFEVRPDVISNPPLTISSSSIAKSSATLIVTGVATSPWPKQIIVAASLFAGETGPYSDPWIFPTATANGIPPPFPMVFFSGRTQMSVGWNVIENAQWTMVTLTRDGPNAPPPMTQKIPWPSDGCSFNLQDMDDVQDNINKMTDASSRTQPRLPPGVTFFLSMESCANGIRGGGTTNRAYVPPDTAGWDTTSTALINTAVVGKNSNIAVTSRIAGQTMEVFFASNAGTIEVSIYDSSLPLANQWARCTLTPAQNDSPPATGATVTAFSKDTNNLEVMWICADGSIAGFYLSSISPTFPTGKWVPGSYSAFSKPGLARTDNNGGRIAAGAISADAVELFWIAPDNTLCAASWTTEAHGWTAAASCDSTKASAQTPLTAGTVDGKSMQAFFLSEVYGSKVTGAYRMAPTSWAAYEVGDGQDVADGSGIAVPCGAGAGSIVNWVKKAGLVSSVWLPRLEAPPPFAVRDVCAVNTSGSGTTVPETGLASVARGNAGVADVFWFDSKGNMLAAETHGDNSGADASWAGFDMTGCSTRVDGGVQTVAAASLDADKEYLFWVGIDSKVIFRAWAHDK